MPPDAVQSARIRQQLARREAELQQVLRAHTVEAALEGGDDRSVADFKDMAVAEVQATVDEVQAAHAVAELHQLQAARGRLDDGSYGQCLDCGEAIDPRRLAALPTTAFCPACQQLREQRAARRP